MGKIVFIGDSVFDNKSYVGNGYSHQEHAERLLSDRHDTLLLAVDGSVTRQAIIQIDNLPHDATHIVVSSGGNDGIKSLNNFLPPNDADAELLEELPGEIYSSPGNESVQSKSIDPGSLSNTIFLNVVNHMSAQLFTVSNIQKTFRNDYKRLCEKLNKKNLPVILCTIYDSIPNLPDVLKTVLSVFNDVIITEASNYGYSVLDLRKICVLENHYSKISPIEPSSRGSEIIVKNLLQILEEGDFNNRITKIYPKTVRDNK